MTSQRLLTQARALALFAFFAAETQAQLQSGPVPPCTSASSPAYPELGVAPSVTYWRPADISKSWNPLECTGWSRPGFAALVTTVARFRYSGSADSLLRRVGAISELGDIRYWSASNSKWKTLIVQALAISEPIDRRPRRDFTANELQNGTAVQFLQTDNLAGQGIYRLRVLQYSPSRVVVSVENVDAMKYFMMTLVPPGEMQTIHFFDRDGPDVWRYYGIVRVGEGANGLVTKHPSSLMNRAVAFFRHYAGIPTDLEPPVVR